MSKIVTSESALKQRLKRFFQGNNAGRMQVNNVCQFFQTTAPLYLFGGAVRDIAVNGIDKFYSDIDLVIDCSQNELDQALNALVREDKSITKNDITQNKFGGYRITTMKWLVDIWPLERTWAFQTGHVQFESVSSLLNTTVLNWDAIVYDFSNRTLIYPPDYFEQLHEGHLELNLVDNPNQKGQAIRILRTLFDKKVHSISPELARYLTRLIHLYGETVLCDYEKKSYRSCYLHSANWPVLYFQLSQSAKAGKVEVDLLQKTMALL